MRLKRAGKSQWAGRAESGEPASILPVTSSYPTKTTDVPPASESSPPIRPVGGLAIFLARAATAGARQSGSKARKRQLRGFAPECARDFLTLGKPTRLT